MPNNIKLPVIAAVAALAVGLAFFTGVKSMVKKPTHHDPMVFTKLSDLVQMEQTHPEQLTPEQQKYLNSLPLEIKQRALRAPAQTAVNPHQYGSRIVPSSK